MKCTSTLYHQQVRKHLLKAAPSTEEQGAGGNPVLFGMVAFKIDPVAMNSLKCQPSAGKDRPCQHIWNAYSRCAPASTPACPTRAPGLPTTPGSCLRGRRKVFLAGATSTPQQERSTAGTRVCGANGKRCTDGSAFGYGPAELSSSLVFRDSCFLNSFSQRATATLQNCTLK